MRFGETIVNDQDEHFVGKYIDYAKLKYCIKWQVDNFVAGAQEDNDNRETSITVGRSENGAPGSTSFFDTFDKEVCALPSLRVSLEGPGAVGVLTQFEAPFATLALMRWSRQTHLWPCMGCENLFALASAHSERSVQLRKLGDTIQQEVNGIRAQLERLQKDVGAVSATDATRKAELTQKGSEIGDMFLRLEKCALALFPAAQ